MHAIEDAFEAYRARLGDQGLVGPTARRGNRYDNATIKSFMKTLKVSGACFHGH